MAHTHTYPNYLSASGWNALLPPAPAKPSLVGDLACKVAIIGAGFTGIAAAKRWAEKAPADSIVLLDSSVIGEGNPGRNSGFLLEVSLAEDANALQVDRMANSNRLLSETMEHIVDEVRKTGDSIDLQRRGTYRAAASAVGMKALNNYRDFLQASNLSFEDLNCKQLKQRIGSEFYQAGLYSPHCYLAQPAQLIRTLAKSLPASVSLFENTPALSLVRADNRWTITSPQGRVIADTVILANNGFAKNLGFGRSRLVAMYTYAALTPVLSDDVLAELGSDTNWGILPTHRLGSTLRRTQDGRLLIRSQHGYEKETPPLEVKQALQQRLAERYPGLPITEFEHVWGGAVGFTYNGGVFWGEKQPGLFVSAGCNGGGTVKGSLLGRLLVDQAFGEAILDVDLLFGQASWMPPEPLRLAGFLASSLVEKITGKGEL
ncbi:MAG: glycine/D-amino acid oxidase-like deaminating enzyme [Pseudohongiellaceae bacterium]